MRRATTSARRLGAVAKLQTRRGMATNVWKVDNPYDGSIYCEVPLATEQKTKQVVSKAQQTFQSWRNTSVNDRIALAKKFVEEFKKQKEQVAADISGQMGKPLAEARGEVNTMIARTEALIELAPKALGDDAVDNKGDASLFKKVSKEPIGVVLALEPWNYPLLCAVNATMSAVLAGCSVVLKHSDRTPLCAEHFERAFKAAGAPEGLVTALHVDHEAVSKLIKHPDIAYVSFTGSVAGGHKVLEAASSRFIDVGLELGGKDPAYVSANADVQRAIDGVVDGAMYNAGQSCCAVEIAYVHRSVYDKFLAGAVDLTAKYVLGDPRDAKTTQGPLAQARAPAFLHRQVQQAKALGARVLIGGEPTADKSGKGRFFQPTIVADCTSKMDIVTEESFGPVLAVAPVDSDEHAIKMMNDNKYGLTASVWTKSQEHALAIGNKLETGTVFMNRCDFLDPYLPWSGRKDSGKGLGMSHLGFQPYIRTKAWNMRIK